MSVCTIATQMFPPKPKWGVDEIPDLSGKIILVTGGNTGIGKETCKNLLHKNAKLYLAARSKEKAMEAISDLEKETGKTAIFLQLDLADLNSVKRAAEEYTSQESTLDVLFCNAGVMVPPMEQVTAQNYDMQFGTNVLGHLLFIRLLYSTVVASTSAESPSRIVWTSSSAQYYFTSPINYNTVKDSPERRKKSKVNLYCQSKFATVLLAFHMSKMCDRDGVAMFVVDPGNIQSDLQRHSDSALADLFGKMILHPLPLGALTQLYAGTSPDALQHRGKYLVPWARVGKPNPECEDESAQEELWNYCDTELCEYL